MTPFHNMALMSPATGVADVATHLWAFEQAVVALTADRRLPSRSGPSRAVLSRPCPGPCSAGAGPAGDLRARHPGAAHLEGAGHGVPGATARRLLAELGDSLARSRRHMKNASMTPARMRP